LLTHGEIVAWAPETAVRRSGVTVLLAVLRALALWATGKRDRQRELYIRAYKTAMAWRGMVYRVRRRAEGVEAERTLIDRFHELQEEIDYYQGWTAGESRWMGRSFCGPVAAIKEATRGTDPVRLGAARAADGRRERAGHRAAPETLARRGAPLIPRYRAVFVLSPTRRLHLYGSRLGALRRSRR
jgi:hypothetical protein